MVTSLGSYMVNALRMIWDPTYPTLFRIPPPLALDTCVLICVALKIGFLATRAASASVTRRWGAFHDFCRGRLVP